MIISEIPLGRWAGRKGARWRRAQRECLAAGEANRTPCYGCGRPINYQLPWPHRLAPTAHHIRELWMGGDPLDPANLAPCHNACNTRLSNLARAAGHPVTRCTAPLAPLVPTSAPFSRRW